MNIQTRMSKGSLLFAWMMLMSLVLDDDDDDDDEYD